MAAEPALAYYSSGPDLTATVLDALRAAGRPTDPIDPDDLASLDEFHGLGRAATVTMARLLELEPASKLVDVGAGIGGPARTLARHFGAHVTAVDPIERFCALNRELTRRSGLADAVTVLDGDGRRLPLPDAGFDAAWTQSVWQSVPDKAALLGELRRVLAPGGRYAMFEVIEGPAAADGLHFPVPWASGPEESFLVSEDEARRLLEAAGFQVREWRVGPSAIEAVGAVAAAGGPDLAAGADGVTLALVLPDFDARMGGLAQNVGDQRVTMLLAVVTLP